MAYTATISSKGQVVIPAKLRKKFGLIEGGRIVFSEKGNQLMISNDGDAAIKALCGKYEGLMLEEEYWEQKRLEREREDRKMEEY